MSGIYMDNAATTAVRREVLEAMLPYFGEQFGNPSSVYRLARENKRAIDDARAAVAGALGAAANEIYFTASGTEADNWAIKGVAEAYAGKGTHIITSCVEHHAVLHTCQYLEKKGFRVTYLPVDEYGRVSPADVEAAIDNDTILVSVMFANNEIGTIQPIAEIGRIAQAHGALFHTDAVQAVGHVPIDVKKMNIDLLSLSAHKLYGPKGAGALYVRKGIKLPAYLHGGAQESKRRAGTENVPGIVGLGKAITLCTAEMEAEAARLAGLRDRLIAGLLERIPHARLNGHSTERLPGNANISFEFIEGESILLLLDMKGIYASSGSACTSGSLDPSHVLLAIGLPHEKAHGSVRMTLGLYNTDADVDAALEALPPIVSRLRDMSPLYEAYVKSQK